MSRLAVVIALALGLLACTYAAPGGGAILSNDGGVAGVVSDSTHIASSPPQEYIVPEVASDHGERIKRAGRGHGRHGGGGRGSSSAAAAAASSSGGRRGGSASAAAAASSSGRFGSSAAASAASSG